VDDGPKKRVVDTREEPVDVELEHEAARPRPGDELA
jgi:hypothetical protein